jgi:hypothetical protein
MEGRRKGTSKISDMGNEEVVREVEMGTTLERSVSWKCKE